jgi:ferrous iron transport protein A
MWLNELAVGDQARVRRIAGTDEISTRLLEMGLTPGATLAILGTAPWGDPIELELRGYRLSVRKSEAARVEVEAVPS